MTIRLLATVSGTFTLSPGVLPPQRAYVVVSGQTVDVPGDMTGDAAVLANQGFIVIGSSGPTSSRPPNAKAGAVHVDTALSLVVVSDGVNWRSPITGAVI